MINDINSLIDDDRYTMVVGALITMAFFFAYTSVRTHAQDLAFTCMSKLNGKNHFAVLITVAVYFWVNVYYGTLYAYTPEVLPSAHRGTGNGIAIACNRVMVCLQRRRNDYCD